MSFKTAARVGGQKIRESAVRRNGKRSKRNYHIPNLIDDQQANKTATPEICERRKCHLSNHTVSIKEEGPQSDHNFVKTFSARIVGDYYELERDCAEKLKKTNN